VISGLTWGATAYSAVGEGGEEPNPQMKTGRASCLGPRSGCRVAEGFRHRWLAVVIVALSAQALLAASRGGDSGYRPIVCDVSEPCDAEVADTPGAKWVPAPAPASSGDADSRLFQFESLGRGRLGDASVRFVALRSTSPAEEDYSPWDRLETLTLYARVTGAEGETWWRLDRAGESFPGPLEDARNIQVDFATPDAALPVFHLSSSHIEPGLNPLAWDQHTVLDFRVLPPRALSSLTCNFYRRSPASRSRVGSDWDVERMTFECRVTKVLPLSWVTREFSSSFPIGPDWARDPATGPHSWSQALEELARHVAVGRRKIGRWNSIPGFGPATPLARLNGNRTSEKLVLFAAPGIGSSFNARFLLVHLRSGDQATVQELHLYQIGESGFLEPLDPLEELGDCEPLEPTGTLPEFTIHHIKDTPVHLRVFRIAVSEGRAQGVFLVAVDTQDDQVFGEGVLLATDAVSEGVDGSDWHPGVLVPTETNSDPFRLTGLVQAPLSGRFVASSGRLEFQPDSDPVLPSESLRAILTWQNAPIRGCVGEPWIPSAGFVLVHEEVSGSPPRQGVLLVQRIALDGAVVAREIPLAPQD
jgi:hypothetical protein